MERRDPLTILHVTAPARVGGLERVVRALATGHVARGHRVHLLAVLEPGDAADHRLLADLSTAGVAVHPLEITSRAYRRERHEFRSMCRRVRPDVVHTHGFRSDVLDAPVAARMGIAVATTVHGFVRGNWKGHLYEWLQKRAYRRYDAVVAVSRPQVEELTAVGVPPQRLHLVQNAWAPGPPLTDRDEARRRLGIPEGRFQVGWVGRLSREKGADVMVDALSHLREGNIGLSVIGGGREESALRARAAAAGVEERILWHGVVPEAAPLLTAFDAFVLSSRTEGTPIALLEAMEARVPIIATRVGGVPDVVSSTEALLVAPQRPDELAAAIEEVKRDPDAAETRMEAASDRLRAHFGISPWLDRYEDIYRQITRSKTRACS